MKSDFVGYTLDANRNIVEVSDVSVWEQWLNAHDRRVAKTKVGGVSVSTVFLGFDHGYCTERIEVFEAMIFGGPRDRECHRYATWDEAVAGHNAVVAGLREGKQQ